MRLGDDRKGEFPGEILLARFKKMLLSRRVEEPARLVIAGDRLKSFPARGRNSIRSGIAENPAKSRTR